MKNWLLVLCSVLLLHSCFSKKNEPDKEVKKSRKLAYQRVNKYERYGMSKKDEGRSSSSAIKKQADNSSSIEKSKNEDLVTTEIDDKKPTKKSSSYTKRNVTSEAEKVYKKEVDSFYVSDEEIELLREEIELNNIYTEYRNELKRENKLKEQIYSFENVEGGEVVSSNQTYFNFRPNTFIDSKGNYYEGKVTVVVLEATRPLDAFYYEKSDVTNDGWLYNEGFYKISFYNANGEKLDVVPTKKYAVRKAVSNSNYDYRVYYQSDYDSKWSLVSSSQVKIGNKNQLNRELYKNTVVKEKEYNYLSYRDIDRIIRNGERINYNSSLIPKGTISKEDLVGKQQYEIAVLIKHLLTSDEYKETYLTSYTFRSRLDALTSLVYVSYSENTGYYQLNDYGSNAYIIEALKSYQKNIDLDIKEVDRLVENKLYLQTFNKVNRPDTVNQHVYELYEYYRSGFTKKFEYKDGHYSWAINKSRNQDTSKLFLQFETNKSGWINCEKPNKFEEIESEININILSFEGIIEDAYLRYDTLGSLVNLNNLNPENKEQTVSIKYIKGQEAEVVLIGVGVDRGIYTGSWKGEIIDDLTINVTLQQKIDVNNPE